MVDLFKFIYHFILHKQLLKWTFRLIIICGKGLGVGVGGLNTKSDNDQFDKTMKAITLDEE